MGEALSVRVGYHLGRNSIREAKRVCVIAFVCATAMSMILSVLMMAAHNYVGRIFSDDPAVIDMASKVSAVYSIRFIAVFHV